MRYVLAALLWASAASAQPIVGALQSQNNLSDLASPATARTNLGLPASATIDATNASNISTGTLASARLPAIPVTQRLPGALDDAAHGYAATDLWTYGGQLYYPQILTTGQATWAQLATAAGAGPYMRPCDTYVAASLSQFCGGAVQWVSGYVGPAIGVTENIAGVATTAAINILASGDFDSASLYAFLARGDHGAPAWVTTIYDQRSGGTNWTTGASPSITPPWIGTTRINGHEVICSDTAGPNQMPMASSVSVSANNFFVLMAGRINSSGGTGTMGQIFSIGDGTAGANSFILYSNNDGHLAAFFQSSLDPGFKYGGPVDSSPSVYSLISTSSSLVTMNDEEVYPFSIYLPAVTLTGGELFSTTAYPSWTSGTCVQGIMIASAAGTAAQQADARQAAYAQIGATPQVRDQIVVVSDSIGQGFHSDSGRNWPNVMRDTLAPQHPVQMINMAVLGTTTGAIISGVMPNAVARYRPGVRNIFIAQAGTNDLPALTPTQIVANLQTIVSDAATAGYEVVLLNVLPRGDAQAANATALRAAIAAATFPGATMVIDPGVGVMASPVSGAYYSSDLVHPLDLGYAAMASFVASAIQPLLK